MIEIHNRTAIPAYESVLYELGERVLAKEGQAGKDVSVACVTASVMSRLNKIYRNKEYAANVLSFEAREFGLGEIVLCPSVIRKSAKEYGITYKEELCRMFLHGLLHLLGYDHDKSERQAERMEQKEREHLLFIN